MAKKKDREAALRKQRCLCSQSPGRPCMPVVKIDTSIYDLDDVRYADLAAGKKVRATAETELSEKEMK